MVSTLLDNHRAFLRYLERRTGDRAVAEDILQDAFVKTIRNLTCCRSDEGSVRWFYRVLHTELWQRPLRPHPIRSRLIGAAVPVRRPRPPEARPLVDLSDFQSAELSDFQAALNSCTDMKNETSTISPLRTQRYERSRFC